MAKQQLKVELFYNGVWNDLTAANDVLTDTPVVISRGNSDESQAPRPATVTCRLKNVTDKYRPANPTSPLYGVAGVNTPLRVSVASSVRACVEASSWSADQTTDFRASPLRGNAWVDVQGGGPLQRIGRWTRSVKSPLRLHGEGVAGLCGLWPCEDPAGTTVAYSPVPGAANTALVAVAFGSQSSPPGGGTGVDVTGDQNVITSGGEFRFLPSAPNSTAGWQTGICLLIPRFTEGFGATLLTGRLSNGFVYGLGVQEDGTVLLSMKDPATGTQYAGGTVSTSPSYWLGRWLMIVMQCDQSGGTVNLSAWWRAVDDPDGFVGFTNSYSGVTSGLQTSLVVPPQGSTFGHVIGTVGTADVLTSDERWDAFLGHPGERAAYRFDRLLNENGIGHYVSSSFAKSQKMGPQGGRQTLAENLRELQTTDDGMVYDVRSEAKLFFLSSADRFNQTPALTLNAAGQDHGMPALPTEVTDDVPIANIVTAKQRDGGDFTARDDNSTMGTQDPPAGKGEYKQDVDVNVANPDTALEQQAHWWLNRGTVDEPRYPQVVVDMTRLSGPQLAAVEAVDVGSVIQIVGYRQDTIRLYVLGYKETIGTHTRQIVFNCAPDRVFNAGKLDTNRLQAKYTIVFPALDATSTTLTLFTGEPNEQWRAGPSGVHIMLGGEEIILGTIGARTGTNPYSQVVTGCTRSVNGVVKGHTVTEFVTVKDGIRLTMGDPA